MNCKLERIVRRLRVFPRRTRATPCDEGVRVGEPGLFDRDVDRVEVSVTFTWDLPEAERIARLWAERCPTEVGGPAVGTVGGEFTPGEFVRKGYVITSRGCPNKCWFCSVWRRDGTGTELPIHDGWNVLDDNLLACSERHVRSVFAMLARQEHRPVFTGGLEAKRLERWHVDLLAEVKTERMYFAYDTPDDYEPLVSAGRLLREADIPVSTSCAYVLVGWPRDTIADATRRLRQTWDAGFTPYAMPFRHPDGRPLSDEWQRFKNVVAFRPCLQAALRDGTPIDAAFRKKPHDHSSPLFDLPNAGGQIPPASGGNLDRLVGNSGGGK